MTSPYVYAGLPLKIDYVVCNEFGITTDELYSHTRLRNVVLPRQIAMYFTARKSKQTLTEIANQYGLSNHATAIYGIKTVKGLIKFDKAVRGKIVNINRILTERKEIKN